MEPLKPNSYARVTFNTGKTVRLKVLSDNANFIQGYEVNNEGDEIQPAGFDLRRHIIQKTEVRKIVPMVHDKMYGTLKVVKPPRPTRDPFAARTKRLQSQVLRRKAY